MVKLGSETSELCSAELSLGEVVTGDPLGLVAEAETPMAGRKIKGARIKLKLQIVFNERCTMMVREHHMAGDKKRWFGKSELTRRYEMKRLLGQGAFGKVKLAQRRSDGLEVAVKHVETGGMDDHVLMHLKDECAILRQARLALSSNPL